MFYDLKNMPPYKSFCLLSFRKLYYSSQIAFFFLPENKPHKPFYLLFAPFQKVTLTSKESTL